MGTPASLGEFLPDWDSAVATLKQRASEFTAAYQAFMSVEQIARAKGAQAYSNWLSVKRMADAARASISAVTGAVDSAYRWFGLSGLNPAGMGSLGIAPAIPLIGVSAILAAAASLAYITPKMYDQYSRNSLVESGAIPPEVGFPPESTWAGNMDKVLTIGGFALAAYLILPYLTKGK